MKTQINSFINTSTFSRNIKCIAALPLFLLLSCSNPDYSVKLNQKNKIHQDPFSSILPDSTFKTTGPVCDINDINVIANNYIGEGKYNEAIELLLLTRDSLLKNGTKNSDLNLLYGIYDNLGNLYSCIKKDSLSIESHLKAISIARSSGNKRNILFGLNNLATTYLNSTVTPIQYEKVISFLTEAVDILEKDKNVLGNDFYVQYLIYSSLSNSYIGIKDYNKAKPYFLKAKQILTEHPRTSYEAICLLTTEADFSIADKDYKQAFLIYEEAISLAEKSNNLELQEIIFGIMKNLAISLNDYRSAYSYIKKEYEISAKRNTDKEKKDIMELQVKYDTKAVEYENKAQKKENNYMRVIGGVALALIISLGLWLKDTRRKKKIITQQRDENAKQRDENAKQRDEIAEQKAIVDSYAEELRAINEELKEKNEIITQQNTELEQSNEEIRAINDKLIEKNEIITQQRDENAKQRDEITQQKSKLEKANTDIKASITYASRIQNSILYKDDELAKHFPESFVFYRPKDIVSGDFYLTSDICVALETMSSKKLLIVADCTGHGVPAALLTIFSNASIKETLSQIKQPSDIINALDVIFKKSRTPNSDGNIDIDSFEKSIHDSVDIECIFYDEKTKELEYSISSRPIIVLRDGEILKLNSDARANVGSEYRPASFTGYKTHKFQLLPGDNVFLFSDGMSDQFTEVTGKPLGSRKFKAMLQKLGTLPVEEREVFLQDYYQKIKGREFQTDDMLMVGFNVK